MEEIDDAAVIESIIREEAKLNGEILDDDGWKTVSNPRRHRKTTIPEINNVFHEERHRRVVEAQRAAFEAVTGEKHFTGDDVVVSDNGNVVDQVEKKVLKVKKPKKKVNISVAEAAAKIDVDDLAAFLTHISGCYESQEDIQLMRFADYFGRAFASTQFPLTKESTVSNMVHIPLSYVPEAVYKTSVDWLSRKSLDALGSFVLWLWEGILADVASHQGPVKGSKKVAQQTPLKSKVALFVVMGMTLRRKPDVLIGLLPILKESQKYVGHDNLYLTVWVITQACQGDLVVGLYLWVQVLLQMLNGKSVNPQSRDLILQLVERVLSMPKARQILLNGAVRKGERLVPPSALDTLMRLTFPSASARVKATERFEAVYPTLKEVALAGPSGSKAMKLVTQNILSVAIKAVGEGVPELCKEASDVFIWCLTENPECYKQWDNMYLDNVEASVLLLKKFYGERKLQSAKSVTREPMKAALNSFLKKNQKALASKEHADDQTFLREADKYCNLLLAQLSEGSVCMKGMLAVLVALVLYVLFNKLGLEDLKRLLENFTFPF